MDATGGGWLLRDVIVVGIIFGTMSFAWFGWGQEAPPERWRPWLGAGSVLGLAVAGVSVWLVVPRLGAPTVFDDPSAGPVMGIAVGTEVVLCGLGALVLARRRRSRYVAAWVSAVVGVHFVPLAFLFDNATLFLAAVTMVAAAVVAVVLGRRGRLAPSAVTGVGAGSALLVTGGINLSAALTMI